MVKKILIACGLAFAGVAWGDVVLPREPASIPEGKAFFGWNTKADGSGIWAEHLGRCERCGALFQLNDREGDSWGCCTNAGCIAEGGYGTTYSVDFFAFRNTVAMNYYPVFIDDGYAWSSWIGGGIGLTCHPDSSEKRIEVKKLAGRLIVSIEGGAFSGCPNLEAVEIGDSVTFVASDAFCGTPLYERQFSVVTNAGGFITADGWLLEAYGVVTNLVIPAGTRGLAYDWYWNLDGEALDTILLPSSLAGKSVHLPNCDFMHRGDRQFIGWNTKADGSGEWARDMARAGGVTYYAQWLPDSWEYELVSMSALYGDLSGCVLRMIGERQDATTTWIIPDAIGGDLVVGIGNTDFEPIIEDATILSVKIPESVRAISAGSFEETGAYRNERRKISDSGLVTLDGWVMSVVGEPTDLAFPAGTRGVASGWFWKEDVLLDGLTSISYPSSMAGKVAWLPSGDTLYRDCQRLVGWNTKADGSGEWVKPRYWCWDCYDFVEAEYNCKNEEWRCAECRNCIDYDSYSGYYIATIPAAGATYYPIFVDEEVCVLEHKGLPIAADKTLRLPAALAGETIRIPCYFDGCPYSWGTEDAEARFLGWCTAVDGKGEWLAASEWPLDLNDWYFDYSCAVTVPEGGLTLYAMTTPETVECVLTEDGAEISYWGEEPSGADWAVPSTICGVPVIAARQSAFDGLQALDDARETAGENGIVTLGGWVIEVNGCHTNLAFAAGARGLAYGWYEYLDGESLTSVKFPASMAGTLTMLPSEEWLWRDGKQFVGWNTAANGSGEWLKKKFWCESCEQYVDSESYYAESECAESEYYCPTCHEWLDPFEGSYQLTVPNGGRTWYAIFADDGEAVGEYDGVSVIFGKKTVLPSTLAGTNVLFPDYSECVPYSWGDDETELRFLGWCTSADGRGAWVGKTWVRSAYDDEQYVAYSFEVPEGGATLYAMTVPYEIDCEKVDGGIALYHWGYEAEGDTWNVPVEICGQPVVQLGGGIDWDTVVEAEDALNIIVPDSVRMIHGATFGSTGAWTNADARVDWASDDIELKVAGWTMLKWGTFTNLVFAEGTRGVATDWWDGLDCEALRTITLPASMAGTRFELPPAYCDGKKFVRWNTSPDGSGQWAEGVFACENCYKWIAPEEIDEDCESYWCCPNCHEWMSPFGEQSTLVTVPEGGVTYYAIFTDCEMNFERTDEGLVLTWADIGDSTSFEIPAEYAGEPVVGIASDCFCGYTCLSNITIPASVEWIDSSAFNDTGLYNAQVEAAGEEPGLIVADGWVISAFGDWTTLALPNGTRGVANDWLEDVNGDILRSIVFPSSLAGRQVEIPAYGRIWDVDGEFGGWNTVADGSGDWISGLSDECGCLDFGMIVIPDGGLTVYAMFQVERYDEVSGIGWSEIGLQAYITELPVTSDNFMIPATVGGKKVVGISSGALCDYREECDAPLSLIIPAGIDLADWDGGFLLDNVNVWKVTLWGDGVSTREQIVSRLRSDWVENMIGWGLSPNAADLVSTAWGYCESCEKYTEIDWYRDVAGGDCGCRCTSCRGEEIEIDDGYYTVSVPPAGATYYRVLYYDEEQFEYEKCDGGVVLTYAGGISEIYEVPSVIDGLPVVAIGESCFAGNERLLSVTVPDTVRWIGDCAFGDCPYLSSVTLPAGLKHIGYDVFVGTQVENPKIAYAAETDLASTDMERVVCTGYFAFLDGGWDEASVFAGDETTLSRQYDGTAFDIEWQYGMQYRVAVTAGEHGVVSGNIAGWWPVGAELALTATPDAHCHFAGWTGTGLNESDSAASPLVLTVSGPVLLQATFDWDSYVVTFDLGGHGTRTSGGELSQSVIYGQAATEPGIQPASGFVFKGWGCDFSCVVGDLVVTALWQELAVVDHSEIAETTVDTSAASVFDGFLYEGEQLAGTIQVKLAKGDKKTGIAKLTATITPAGGKKTTASGNFDPTDESFVATAKDGTELELVIGADGLYGTFGKYDIDGARNLYSSKDADDKQTIANADQWIGSYALVCETEAGSDILTVTVAKKGKVKVSGTLADGTKVSSSAQMIVGAERCCIPVVYSKKNVSLAFTIWLGEDGAEVVGLDGAIFGRVGNLADSASFSFDGSSLVSGLESSTTTVLSEYLPDGAEIALSGAKWIVMPDESGKAMKAGKLVWDKKTGEINEAKSKIEGYNVSGLKLTFTAKTGAFKGSFKVYTVVKGAFKNTTVNVTGVVIDGVGYGTATIKKVGNFAARIE